MKDINATVIVNLRPSEEEILAHLHKDARWGINRAKKEGLVVQETTKEEDWKEFYLIYSDYMKKNGLNYFSLEELKQKAKISFVCKKEDKVVAGAGIWFVDKYDLEIPRLFFNSSLEEFLNLQPNNLLYWECIKWAKKQGYGEFDLGGWQINANKQIGGVNKFKEKWGQVVYFKKNYPFFTAIGRKLVRNFKFFKWLNEKLKK